MRINNLSIIIPVYNEEETITTVLEKILSVNLLGGIDKEMIIINDGSDDGTGDVINKFIEKNPGINIHLLNHLENKGKGKAVRSGLELTTGEYTIIQDADLEYDPNEYNILLKPVMDGYADVVYGSRFLGGSAHRILFFWHSLGNKFLTFFSNMFTNLNLTDMETCYKLFNTKMLKGLNLKENRFGFEPEVTAKISRVSGVRIYEVGISYYGRQFEEGKKINWRDGLWAIVCVLKYNIFK